REGFRGTNGNLYVSTNGMGGLMFVGHQSGGYVHAFDLDPDSSAFAYVGRFKTGQSETAGLEFDRTAGQLYVWHNTGSNFLEVTELNSYVDGSDRRLRQMAEYYGPRSGNLEGFAMLPLDETNNWCFITDDDNSGGEAVVWYREFEPSEDTDSDSLPDGWELWHFGTATQTVGDADSDLDGMINVGEYTAGTEPTNAASVLSILPLTVLTNALALSWPSVSGRVYAIWQAGAVASGFTQVVEEAIAATAPLNCSTVDVPEAVSGMLYRISVEAP
ncbi:MAG: hypothetical protein JXB04_05335, partial [Kiritimatiellae bacterium]|nr:hypothetical protein [Kiritimatiellia bacterium]